MIRKECDDQGSWRRCRRLLTTTRMRRTGNTTGGGEKGKTKSERKATKKEEGVNWKKEQMGKTSGRGKDSKKER